MKLNSFYEAVSDYERITGEKFKWDAKNMQLVVLPSNEWFIWAIGERDGVRFLWLDQMYGFTKNFIPYIKEIGVKHNLEIVVTTTTRNPKMHIRKWKMKRLPEYDYTYEGRYYYVLQSTISNFK